MSAPPTRLVLDTNIVLDLFVFQDDATLPLHEQLASASTRWCATVAMREELARVLGYPQIARRLSERAQPAAEVLARFDLRAQIEPAAPRAAFACKDADDQKFIDLAVTHRAVLLSKDDQVLRMARRLATLGVQVCRRWPAGTAVSQPLA